ncbi:hypothetical protein HMPREF1550_02424 [Actinomyces sp. oral taxon 877 str. F0543]|nr:hypothetical protein HMPREF1550_02424 [Actinomyces sp. oral taxon 877 str. F0543]
MQEAASRAATSSSSAVRPSPSGGVQEAASRAAAGYRVERPTFSNPKSMLTDFLHVMCQDIGDSFVSGHR